MYVRWEKDVIFSQSSVNYILSLEIDRKLCEIRNKLISIATWDVILEFFYFSLFNTDF